MAAIKPEELIEEVRKYPVLYDQTKEQYRNSDYKDMIWKKVAKELNVEGQDEACKRKWNGIRDSLRRARQKSKAKSGQAGTSTNKYKYETILEFLIPHLAERKGLSNVYDNEDNDDTHAPGSESQQQNSIQGTQQPLDISNPDEPEETTESSPLPHATIPANRVSAERRPSYVGRKRKLLNTEGKAQKSASSQLMAYILAEKEIEKTNKSRSQNSEQHPVDAFLAGIAPSLKFLSPVRLLAARGKIFNVVQEYELEQHRANIQQRTTTAYMYPSSSAQMSSASTPAHNILSEEDGPYAETDGPPHFPNHVAPTPKSPTITTEEYTNLSFVEF